MHEMHIDGSGEIFSGGPDIGYHNRFSFTFDVDTSSKTGRPLISGYFLPIDYQRPQKDTEAVLRGILMDKGEDEQAYLRMGTLDVSGTYILRFLYRSKDLAETEETDIDWTALEDAHAPDWKRYGPDPNRHAVSDEEDGLAEDLESAMESLQIEKDRAETPSSLFTWDAALKSEVFERVLPQEITIL